MSQSDRVYGTCNSNLVGCQPAHGSIRAPKK